MLVIVGSGCCRFQFNIFLYLQSLSSVRIFLIFYSISPRLTSSEPVLFHTQPLLLLPPSHAPTRYHHSPRWRQNQVSQIRRSFSRSFPGFLFYHFLGTEPGSGHFASTHAALPPHPGPHIFMPTSPLEPCLGLHPLLHPCSGATPGPGPNTSASAPPVKPCPGLGSSLHPRPSASLPAPSPHLPSSRTQPGSIKL